jgi:hypothetical protein
MDLVRGVMEACPRDRRGGDGRSIPRDRDDSRCDQKGRELEDANYRYLEKSTKISFSLFEHRVESVAIPLYLN